MEEAAIQFYKVTRCGYYEYWSPDAEFGNLRGTLSTLDDWANKDDMVLRHTGIYEPDEGSNIDPVYCYDVRHSEESGNYLLVTWNQTPDTDEQFPSAEGDSPVGNVNVEMTDVPDGTIPGYATYFWFLPDEDLMATVQFQHRLRNGNPGLRGYLSAFLARYHDEHVVLEGADGDDEVEIPVKGYRPDFRLGCQREGTTPSI
jgi:hypothetical protein